MHSRPAVRQLLTDRGLAPRRDLGQNFVVDPNTVRRIARLARVGPGDRVVEIGAGLGSLTLALAETGADVIAVEVDDGLAAALPDIVADHGNVRVVHADAVTLDWEGLLGGREHVMVANLPYNIATPLVCDVLDGVPLVSRLLVMVQREVGERFAAARRGDPACGAVSVKVAYWANARVVGLVPASVFVPRPKVESALVEIERHDPPPTPPEPFFALVRKAFGQRRKMLRRSLAGIVGDEQFAAAGVAPTARPEELDVAAWCRLVDATPMTATPAVLAARAKLTRTLRVVGVRADGYHLIDAEMVTLDLADRLTVDQPDEPAGTSTLTASGPFGAGVPTDGTNLVLKALAAVGRSAVVHIDKQIPGGGGLGGGSADAAAILRWAGVDDLDLAVRLGADVPFCVVGGRARVGGIGEVIDRLPHAAMTVTLVVPPFGVATPAVYAAWDRLGGPTGLGPNDLEVAAVHVEPRLVWWRDRIGELAGVVPVLAGSGATWFVEGRHDDALAPLRDAGATVYVARTV